MTASRLQLAAGVGCVLAYTLLATAADGVTKHIAGLFAAPQMYFFSGLVVMALAVAVNRARARPQSLAIAQPRLMALRCVMTVSSAVGYFYAFRLLPFAEVFLFVGLMPLISGLLSGPVLGERVSPRAWAALALGFVGVLALFPEGLGAVGPGHLVALAAATAGTGSMVLARKFALREDNAFAQLFYPNLALSMAMGLALPLVYKPMALADLGWIAGYGAFLFAARFCLVHALTWMAAYVVTPLINLQFVWMVLLGVVLFGEHPTAQLYVGVTIVIASGLALVLESIPLPGRRMRPV
ncbi:DMT family transporter [Mesobacterium pallidum]|uniref:DMT family transporter n=1 Tax=Mesobacterium pallidum TaxID=2872037 RepID=UPI001EE1744C|nr:DMT family transporter [Mesobacterium pallidum]